MKKQNSKIKYKIITYFLILSTIFMLLNISAYASLENLTNGQQPIQTQKNTIEITYHFAKPKIQKIIIEDSSYDRIILPETSNFGKPGEPELPYKGARILLPPQTQIEQFQDCIQDELIQPHHQIALEFY